MKLKQICSMLLGVGLGLGLASSAVADKSLKEVMEARGLTEKDVLAAAKARSLAQTPGGFGEREVDGENEVFPIQVTLQALLLFHCRCYFYGHR